MPLYTGRPANLGNTLGTPSISDEGEMSTTETFPSLRDRRDWTTPAAGISFSLRKAAEYIFWHYAPSSLCWERVGKRNPDFGRSLPTDFGSRRPSCDQFRGPRGRCLRRRGDSSASCVRRQAVVPSEGGQTLSPKFAGEVHARLVEAAFQPCRILLIRSRPLVVGTCGLRFFNVVLPRGCSRCRQGRSS